MEKGQKVVLEQLASLQQQLTALQQVFETKPVSCNPPPVISNPPTVPAAKVSLLITNISLTIVHNLPLEQLSLQDFITLCRYVYCNHLSNAICILLISLPSVNCDSRWVSIELNDFHSRLLLKDEFP